MINNMADAVSVSREEFNSMYDLDKEFLVQLVPHMTRGDWGDYYSTMLVEFPPMFSYGQHLRASSYMREEHLKEWFEFNSLK